ncbi:MAG: tetratricopeptide repeat protein [Candidatus Limnocylindria bacterium]
MKSLEFIAGRLGKPVSYFVEDEEGERRRKERELDLASAAALVTRATAAKAIPRLRELLDQDGTASDFARLRLLAGTSFNFLGQSAEALRELAVAERLARQLADEALERSVRYQEALAIRNLGDSARAFNMLSELLATVESATNPDQIFRMKLLKDLGAIAIDLGEPEKANGYLQSALQWANEIGDVAGLITIYHGLAHSYRALGDLDGATGFLQKALGATEVSNDLTAAAVLHNALAVFAAERGHVEAAYRHVDRAIEIARVNGPAAYVPHYLNTKAECVLKLGDVLAARRLADDALQLAQSLGNQKAAAAALVILGEIAQREGDGAAGVQRLTEAATIYRAVGSRGEAGEVYMRLSRWAHDQGATSLAEQYATMAYELTRQKTHLVGGT